MKPPPDDPIFHRVKEIQEVRHGYGDLHVNDYLEEGWVLLGIWTIGATPIDRGSPLYILGWTQDAEPSKPTGEYTKRQMAVWDRQDDE